MIFIRPDGTPSVSPADLTTPSAKRAFRAAIKAAQRAEAERVRRATLARRHAAKLRHQREAAEIEKEIDLAAAVPDDPWRQQPMGAAPDHRSSGGPICPGQHGPSHGGLT